MNRRPRVVFTKARMKKFWKLLFVLIVASSIGAIAWFGKWSGLARRPVTELDGNLTSIEFVVNPADEFALKVRNATARAFDLYYSNCVFEDEYRPDSHRCLSSFGFSATLLESIEALHIMGLTEQYNRARDFVKHNFSCAELGWVNRREMFSRGVGSLIGSYLVTRDRLFLKKASECADQLLLFDSASPFVNFAERKIRMRGWHKGTAIIDIIAGLPELLALHALTKNESYSIGYLSILNNLPGFPTNSSTFYSFYNPTKRKGISSLQRLDTLTVGFIHNLQIAQKLRPMRKMEELLQASLSNLTLSTTEISVMLYPLYEIFAFCESRNMPMNVTGVDAFKDAVKMRHFAAINELFEPGRRGVYEGFRFEGSVLRANAYVGEGRTKNTILEALTRCASGQGFTGTIRTNTDAIVSSDIQHSSFFAEWMSIAGYIATGRTRFLDVSIFNERGHLLHSPLIVKAEEGN